jgi:hypothetical protein
MNFAGIDHRNLVFFSSQPESHPLLCGNVLGPDPAGKPIGGAGLHDRQFTSSLQIGIMFAVKGQPQ